jgi:hypothetical protein
MPRPVYPTREGIWSKGKRKEAGYAGVRLGMPYPEAVEQFRKSIKGRDDFDPAVLFAWGTMQATAVLNILKAAEETFGKEGQDLVRKATNRAGYEAMQGLLKTSSFPEELDEMEMASYVVTGINTVLYASLEKPWIVSKDRCEFDILWCPHQGRYSAFDCRVQRYFVEGMFQALDDMGKGGLTAWVERLIPHGAECCHFVVQKRKDDGKRSPWHIYSDELGQKAFRKLKEQKDKKTSPQ